MADEVAEVRAVLLDDGRLAAAVPPRLEPHVRQGTVDVRVLVEQPEGGREERAATATVVRSGRVWAESRALLRTNRGWARRFARSPAEVVVLTLRSRDAA